MPPTFRADLPTVAFIFIALWMVGLVSSYTMGGFLHLFPLVAIGMVLPRIIWGRKAAE